jgi:L-alanine-DL-glutamate epimerase-like enolase superfamily enzyme
MQLELRSYELPFKHPFTISRKSKSVQPLLVVCLSQEGHTGYGETADNAYYQMTVPLLVEEIERLRPLIESYSLHAPTAFWEFLHPHLKHNPFALCALDMAAHDLFGRLKGKKLYELWNLDISKNPLTDYTIGIDSIPQMIHKLKEQPWPIYKIKLGTNQDMDIIRALRVHTEAIFRIDANGAWTADQTLEYAPILKDLGVEFLEQPLAATDVEGMKRLYKECILPIIADESCIVESDVAACVGLFHGINIKLTKCGGLTPARRMIAEAKASGLHVMTGSMNESTVGTSAVAHLLPELDYVDMDGPLLLAEDIATGIWMENGHIYYPDLPGTGVTLIR